MSVHPLWCTFPYIGKDITLLGKGNRIKQKQKEKDSPPIECDKPESTFIQHFFCLLAVVFGIELLYISTNLFYSISLMS
jgi:hypothetical protein